MTHPLSFIIDIDEVLFPFAERAHVASIVAGLCPKDSPAPPVWDPFTHYGVEGARWWEALRAATYAGTLYEAEPIAGSVGALWRLEHAGHHLHLVTARGTHSSLDDELAGLIKAATVRWLAEHHVPYDSLTFSKDKTVVPGDYGVDDHVANYDALEAAGVAAWLVDKPWNQDEPGQLPRRRRVNSLSDFADMILTKEAIPA